MTAIAEDWLVGLIDEVRPHLGTGAVSTYLPELRQADAGDPVEDRDQHVRTPFPYGEMGRQRP